MEKSIDSFYTNGKMHGHKGEDYAIHGEDYFIICDGCSSAKNSDIVARLQAHITGKFINTLRYTSNYNLVAQCISNELNSIMNLIGCNDGMPLATLMIGFVDYNNIKILTFGDGCIVHKYKNDKQEIMNIAYSNNAPYYPYYYSEESFYEYYKKQHPNAVKYINDVVEEPWDIEVEIEKPFFETFSLKNLEYIYIFSDGIEEFSGLNGKIDIKETVKSFTNMKNINDSFIQRRCKRQLKVYAKDGIEPNDDFSMAGIYFKE